MQVPMREKEKILHKQNSSHPFDLQIAFLKLVEALLHLDVHVGRVVEL